MFTSNTITFLLGASIASLSFTNASPTPVQHRRAVTELNQEAFEEAHSRDAGATRAFEGVEIKTSDGQCLFIDELSGDFRANLTPIQIAACDGSQGQSWDVISSGIHNNVAGKVLVVNTLTQACLDLNKGRVGREVSTFSCGGRADGSGEVSRDQLFTVAEGSFALTTDAADGTCLSVSGNVVLPADCVDGSAAQTFTIGEGGAADEEVVSSSEAAAEPTSVAAEIPVSETPCTKTTLVTVTRDPTSAIQTSAEAVVTSAVEAPVVETSIVETSVVETSIIETSTAAPVAAPTATALPPPAQGNPTEAVPVSRAGGTLNPTLAAEAHTRDDSATRAFSSVSIRDANGQCLFVDPTAGDFRQNLIPVAVRDCTGAEGEKFDLITSGIHNNQQGKTLVVSSLMQGCLNFDSRRAAGDTVLIFSCGGRAAGEGQTTDDQLFDFTGGNEIVLSQTKRDDPTTCLVPVGGKLDSTQNCAGDVATYSIV